MTRTTTTCPITSRHAGPLRSAGGADRSSLVTAGAGHRARRTDPAAGFDETDPALHAAYGPAPRDTTDTTPRPTRACPGRWTPRAGYRAVRYGRIRHGWLRTGLGTLSAGKSSRRGRRGRGYRVRADRAGGAARGPPVCPRRRTPVPPAAGIRGPAREGAQAGRDVPAAGPLLAAEDPAGTDFGAPGPGAAGPPRPPGARRPGRPRRATGELRGRADRADRQPVPIRPRAGLRGSDDPAKPVTAHPGGRRRITKVQKPQLRLGRSRQDYDNDPWPSPDEIDGVSDDQFWSDLSSDKPLATTARAAQDPSDSGQPWAPGDGPGRPGPPAGPGSTDMVSAPVPADAPAMGRGRRARGRAAEPEEGTEPRPRQQADGGAVGPRGPGGPAGTAGPGTSGGSRRRGEPKRSPRGAGGRPVDERVVLAARP